MAGADEFTLQESSPFALSGSRARPHGLALVAEPATTRYLRIRFAASGSASLPQAGILMIGTRFEHPYELKSGRRPIDLSDRADLVGGGFGFGRGAIKSSYRFTFSGLDDTQLGALLDTVEAVGIQHPVLVVEGGDGPITQRQVHYGVFNAFEAYEREESRRHPLVAFDHGLGVMQEGWLTPIAGRVPAYDACSEICGASR